MADKPTLKLLLGDYPHTAPIKTGEIVSPVYDLAFTEIQPVWDGFKAMVRERQFDVAEMAIVTFLMARAHGKPMLLLPACMIGRFQQPWAIYNAKVDLKGPGDLAGRRVGVRSYTTTTVSWLRGILAQDFGANLDAALWTSFEDPHVAEYQDPTTRAPAGAKIVDMLLDGELDVVLGESSSDPRAKNLFGDPAVAARAWYGKRGVVPINHLVVVSEDLASRDIGAVAEIYRLLKAGKAAAPPPEDGLDYTAIGIEALRPALDLIIDYAFQQQLIPSKPSVDELFDERIRKAIGE